MHHSPLKTAFAALLGAGLLAATIPTQAQDKRQIAPGFPNKPIRILVSVLAGGGMDTVTRAVANKLAERLPVTVIVENVAGASGVIAANTVINATPDGHTLLSTSGSLPLNVAFKKMQYDVRTALQAVAQMSYQPYIVIVSAGAPYKTIQDL